MDIVDFLIKNEEKLSGYFEDIQVNHNETHIKAGGKSGDGFSINFAITGELDNTITSFEDKIKALFNYNEESKDSIDYLNECIKDLPPFEFITESPFIKFNDEPLMHAFRISIDLIDKEVTE